MGGSLACSRIPGGPGLYREEQHDVRIHPSLACVGSKRAAAIGTRITMQIDLFDALTRPEAYVWSWKNGELHVEVQN
jgi:hypothetical protein